MSPATVMLGRLVLVLALLSCSVHHGFCKRMVRLSGVAGFTSTSSTLAWVPPPKDGTIPHYAVHVGHEEEGGGPDGSPVWCRGRWRDNWISGELQLQGMCVIAFLKSVFKVDQYEILVSVGGAARVKWVPWDMHMAKPDKSLTTPQTLLVVVYDEENRTSHTGNLGTSNSARTANVYDRVQGIVYEASKVHVLVEIEPIRYTLTDIQLDLLLDSSEDNPSILSTTTLTNDGDEDVKVSEETTYVVKESQYWGRVKGTETAIPAVVYPPEGDPLDILWGVDTELDRVHVGLLEYELPAGTGVNVTIMGKIRHYEAPYFATIRAYYADDKSRTWRINSFHSHKVVLMIIVQYDSPFYLDGNGSVMDIEPTSKLLYELTTTTTTTPAPTTESTTTTTTTTTPPPISTTPTVSSEIDTDSPLPSPGEVQLPPEIGSLSRDGTVKPSYYQSDGSQHQGLPETYTEDPLKSGGQEQLSASYRTLSAIAGIVVSLFLRYYYTFVE